MLALSVFPSFVTTRIKQPTLARTSKAEPIRAMRAVVQRVASASVEVSLSLSLSLSLCIILRHRRIITFFQVEGRIVSEIGPGLLVLVGLHEPDSDTDADYMYSILILFLFF
jgi:D-tyrosyl-tRNA(Tyr) deacylase